MGEAVEMDIRARKIQKYSRQRQGKYRDEVDSAYIERHEGSDSNVAASSASIPKLDAC